jgi:hypothetical protein
MDQEEEEEIQWRRFKGRTETQEEEAAATIEQVGGNGWIQRELSLPLYVKKTRKKKNVKRMLLLQQETRSSRKSLFVRIPEIVLVCCRITGGIKACRAMISVRADFKPKRSRRRRRSSSSRTMTTTTSSVQQRGERQCPTEACVMRQRLHDTVKVTPPPVTFQSSSAHSDQVRKQQREDSRRFVTPVILGNQKQQCRSRRLALIREKKNQKNDKN